MQSYCLFHIVAFIIGLSHAKPANKSEGYQKLGCWRDSKERAIPKLEGKHPLLLDHYTKRKDPLKKCAISAKELGYKVFALQNGGQCFGGKIGQLTYKKYGPSNLCEGGNGGSYSSSVYSTQLAYHRSLETPKTLTSYHCTKRLEIVFMVDGSGYGNPYDLRRWLKLLHFTASLADGFDDKYAYKSMIRFGDEPKLVVDMNTAGGYRKKLKDAIPNLKYPGGVRTLNEALKLSWSDVYKKSHRKNISKVIVAMTTGGLPFSLTGSVNFLTNKKIRVIGIGLDHYAPYTFLQSLASGRFPRNIFSLDTYQLESAVPYVLQEICDGIPGKSEKPSVKPVTNTQQRTSVTQKETLLNDDEQMSAGNINEALMRTLMLDAVTTQRRMEAAKPEENLYNDTTSNSTFSNETTPEQKPIEIPTEQAHIRTPAEIFNNHSEKDSVTFSEKKAYNPDEVYEEPIGKISVAYAEQNPVNLTDHAPEKKEERKPEDTSEQRILDSSDIEHTQEKVSRNVTTQSSLDHVHQKNDSETEEKFEKLVEKNPDNLTDQKTTNFPGKGMENATNENLQNLVEKNSNNSAEQVPVSTQQTSENSSENSFESKSEKTQTSTNNTTSNGNPENATFAKELEKLENIQSSSGNLRNETSNTTEWSTEAAENKLILPFQKHLISDNNYHGLHIEKPTDSPDAVAKHHSIVHESTNNRESNDTIGIGNDVERASFVSVFLNSPAVRRTKAESTHKNITSFKIHSNSTGITRRLHEEQEGRDVVKKVKTLVGAEDFYTRKLLQTRKEEIRRLVQLLRYYKRNKHHHGNQLNVINELGTINSIEMGEGGSDGNRKHWIIKPTSKRQKTIHIQGRRLPFINEVPDLSKIRHLGSKPLVQMFGTVSARKQAFRERNPYGIRQIIQPIIKERVNGNTLYTAKGLRPYSFNHLTKETLDPIESQPKTVVISRGTLGSPQSIVQYLHPSVTSVHPKIDPVKFSKIYKLTDFNLSKLPHIDKMSYFITNLGSDKVLVRLKSNEGSHGHENKQEHSNRAERRRHAKEMSLSREIFRTIYKLAKEKHAPEMRIGLNGRDLGVEDETDEGGGTTKLSLVFKPNQETNNEHKNKDKKNDFIRVYFQAEENNDNDTTTSEKENIRDDTSSKEEEIKMGPAKYSALIKLSNPHDEIGSKRGFSGRADGAKLIGELNDEHGNPLEKHEPTQRHHFTGGINREHMTWGKTWNREQGTNTTSDNGTTSIGKGETGNAKAEKSSKENKDEKSEEKAKEGSGNSAKPSDSKNENEQLKGNTNNNQSSAKNDKENKSQEESNHNSPPSPIISNKENESQEKSSSSDKASGTKNKNDSKDKEEASHNKEPSDPQNNKQNIGEEGRSNNDDKSNPCPEIKSEDGSIMKRPSSGCIVIDEADSSKKNTTTESDSPTKNKTSNDASNSKEDIDIYSNVVATSLKSWANKEKELPVTNDTQIRLKNEDKNNENVENKQANKDNITKLTETQPKANNEISLINVTQVDTPSLHNRTSDNQTNDKEVTWHPTESIQIEIPNKKSTDNLTKSLNNQTMGIETANHSSTEVVKINNIQHLTEEGKHLGTELQQQACNHQLKVMYVIDVSNGLGVGVERAEKWQRLRNFISRVNYGMISDANIGYVVYDVEPRYLSHLQPCDEKTEAFFAGDPCLCQDDPYALANSGVCGTVAPTNREDIEDFGLHGPRTGRALEKAEQMLRHNSTGKEKNLIILISHLPTTDNVENAEAKLKSEGTSLIDIEVGDNHDIRRRSSASSSNSIVPAEHQMEVSIFKLDTAVNTIFKKLCRKNDDILEKKSYILRAHYHDVGKKRRYHRKRHHHNHWLRNQ